MPLSSVPVWQNGNAAIHAARALLAQLFLLHVEVKFLPVRDALDRRTVRRQFAQILDESCGFAHLEIFRF